MTVPDRVMQAGADVNVVIGASELLAAFNDAGVLAPIDVLSALSLGRIYGVDDSSVLLAAALAVRGTRHGHVCVRLDDLREAVFADGQTAIETGDLPWPSPGPWTSAVAASALVGYAGDDTPLILVDDRLYLQRYHSYEELIAGVLDAAVAAGTTPLDPSVAALLDESFKDSGVGPNRQRQAAEVALGSRLAVIAGGPGTGKTYTIAAMLSALAQVEAAFPSVALVAPTGKAAARLGEAVVAAAASLDGQAAERLLNVKASTIHRLLGFSHGRGSFAHDRDNRLPYDMIIVDEMSMVSVTIAAKLLGALRDDATLVLVGDPDQLVSIEAGTVLADIVRPAHGSAPRDAGSPTIADHIVVLDREYRFPEDSAIAQFADAVRRGDTDSAIGLLRAGSGSGSESADLVWIADESGDAFSGLVTQIVDHRVKLVELSKTVGSMEAALDQLNGLAVLAAHRNGPSSVDYWRRLIEDSLDEKFPGMRSGADWYPGQPVMITANDRGLDLYNGDIGVTVETDDGLRVAFAGQSIRTFHRSHIGEHATVHAMTIHKSQGSQYDEVVVVLPPGSSPLLTRELLYTAVTRAAKRVTLLGPEATIRQAISRPVERATGLATRLWHT